MNDENFNLTCEALNESYENERALVDSQITILMNLQKYNDVLTLSPTRAWRNFSAAYTLTGSIQTPPRLRVVHTMDGAILKPAQALRYTGSGPQVM